MHRLHLLAAVLGATALAACGSGGPQDIVGTLPTARVKFFNFGVNAPGVNFYANDAKITAVSSSACTPANDTACFGKGIETATGTTSGLAAAGGFYTGIAPGQYTLSSRIAAVADNGLAIASVPIAIADGKFYSMYVSGIYNTTAKSSDAFIVEDNYPQTVAPDTIYVRFVNAISNAPALTLYFRNPTTSLEGAVGSTQAYKTAGSFVAIGGGSGITDLIVRATGSSANAITRTGVALAAGRVYTITARGDFTVTSTTATTRPQLDNTPNR